MCATRFLQPANFGKDGEPDTLIPGMNQKILAHNVGTTRGRVQFFHEKIQDARCHRVRQRDEWNYRPMFAAERRTEMREFASHGLRHPKERFQVVNMEQTS